MAAYTVVWLREAEDQLAEIWLDAQNRQAVTSAQARIDAALASEPARKGMELSEGLRRLIDPPLKAYFEVDEGSHRVQVTAVIVWP